MWPQDFVRIPQDDPWVHSPVGEEARMYDAVQKHSWYRNLAPVLDELQSTVRPGDIVIDYSIESPTARPGSCLWTPLRSSSDSHSRN